MKCRVRRAELLTALEAVEPGLSVRDIVEQSSCFVFRKGWVLTYNDETAVRVRGPLPADFTGAVSGKPLLETLRRLEVDDLVVSASGSEFRVAGGRDAVGVRMESEVLLPLGSVQRPREWSKLHKDFPTAVGMVQEFVGRDDAMFHFTCVHLTPEFVEASDNTQMVRVRVATPVTGPALLRRDSVKHVAALGVTWVAETEEWLHFRAPARADGDDTAPELIISCRRYTEEYPDLNKFLEFRGPRAELPRDLAAAVGLASVFSAENADDDQVIVGLRPGRARVRGEGLTGWAERRARVKYKGPPIEFRVAPKLLTRVVEHYQRCQVGRDRVNGAGGPALYKLRADGRNWTYLTCLGEPGPAGNDETEPAEPEETEAEETDDGEEQD